jgi:Holliday junction resolvasome RuvABC ATP-dependent DNA helicase subunit
MKNYFADVIGQQRAVSALNFYISGHARTGFFSPAFLSGSKGFGKTMMARAIGRNLIGQDGVPKRFIEVNGASARSIKSFVEGLIVPHVAGDQEVTLFIDEIHSVDSKIHDWLLSVLPANDSTLTRARYGEMEFEFNFSRFSFIAASTNPEALSKPLLSRMKVFDLEPYKPNELVKIFRQKLGATIKLEDKVENEIISVVRGSPRLVTRYAQDIKEFCGQKKLDVFGMDDWKALSKILGVRPYGLMANEVEHLRFLQATGPQSLTAVSAKLGLDRTTVQKEVELFLLSQGLMIIDGKRTITPRGQTVLEECGA